MKCVNWVIVILVISLVIGTVRSGNSTWKPPPEQSPCEDYQVSFYPDEDSTKPLQCGECIPGTSGIDSKEHCRIDEYCTDEGTCRHVSLHPLFLASCPREMGTSKTRDGFCGPGLRCLQHQCRQCISGMMDYADGKICVEQIWTYDSLRSAFFNPTFIFFFAFVFLVLFHMISDCCFDSIYALRKRRRKQREENYRVFYQYLCTRKNPEESN